MIAAISDPRVPLSSERSRSHSPSSNVMFSLQHDTGKVCTEYTWSAEDGMWGVRSLYNFGRLGTHTDSSTEEGEKAGHAPNGKSKVKRVDEEEAMEGGLKGRVSVGGEFYFSAKEKSAGGRLELLHSHARQMANVLSSCSFYWYSLHDSTRRHTTFVPGALIVSSWTLDSPRTSISASHNDHCPLQSHARTHLRGVRRQGVA